MMTYFPGYKFSFVTNDVMEEEQNNHAVPCDVLDGSGSSVVIPVNLVHPAHI
jgi:hypothetical protein